MKRARKIKKTNKKRNRRRALYLFRLTVILEIMLMAVLVAMMTIMIYVNYQVSVFEEKIGVNLIVEYAEQISVEESIRRYINDLPLPEEEGNVYKDYETEEDFVLCLAYAEAADQGIYGQKLVLETIRNRVQSERFPDTMLEVCLQESQFSPIENGVPILSQSQVTSEVITSEMRQNFQEVLLGSNETEKLLKEEAYRNGLTDEKYWKGGALFFTNLNEVEILVNYEKIKVSVKVGNHTFWRYWDQ